MGSWHIFTGGWDFNIFSGGWDFNIVRSENYEDKRKQTRAIAGKP
jgi:hypothetical protein